ncbi:magnesium transporter [Tepidanaerobacter sp. EBM-49]|uniref:magnesium transporter n=1 Tax=Tepidanaerobacter sp. EBM-49 TaxID=1918504 RepID=UPI000A47A210|nr:magnesium transporter [Tepidanaerobacter sp. EBM-49]
MIEIEKIYGIINEGDIEKLKNELKNYHPVDIAELLDELLPEQCITLFGALEFDDAVQVLEEIDTDKRYFILTNIDPDYASKLISEMSSDILADFLGELKNGERKKILSLMKEEDKKELKNLLAYDEDTAGGRMTTDYIAFPQHLKAKDVLDRLAEIAPDAETIYYLYVIDSQGKLVGVISLRDLILAPEDAPIKEFMKTDVKKINVSAPQEEAAQMIQKYGLLALPVVDDNDVLLGIVTVDDAMTVTEEETTEDILKFSGSDIDKTINFEEISPWSRAKRRLPWILVAIAGEIISGRVINNFSEALQTIVALSFFIPVLMDMGGNVGTQSAAIVIRGLATGTLTTASMIKNILREAVIGAILGLINGLVVAAVTYVWQGEILLGVTVGIAMAINLTIAAALGTFMPLFWHKMGRDPAVASGPFVTTLLDVLGLFIYFSTAAKILKL